MAANDAAPSVVSERDDILDRHLADVLERLRIEVVVDVGASWGQYRGLLRKIGFAGRIVSFEPVGRPWGHCAALAVDDPAWDVHKIAIGSRSGARTIKVGSSDDFSSFRPLSEYGRRTFEELDVAAEERVPVRTLDG